MPVKMRELKAILRHAGFSCRSGKGSHTVWSHPDLSQFDITLSGRDGEDAKPYQIKKVHKALAQLGE